MNSLDKRNAITAALDSRPDAMAILAKYRVTRTMIGKNDAAFAAIRDQMFDELCPAGAVTCDYSDESTPATEYPTTSAPMTNDPASLVSLLSATLEQLKNAPAGGASPAPAGADPAEIRRLEGQIRSLATSTRASVDSLDSDLRTMATKIEAVETALAGASPASIARAAVAVSAASGGLSPGMMFLHKMLPVGGNLNGNAVMLMGGSGTGKSYDAEVYAKAFDYAPAPFACSPLTEGWELFGCVNQTEKGLAFVDGYISAGIRHASEGKTVCLILDELPRLSDSVKMALLTLLTPRKGSGAHAGKLVFTLRTGRAQEISPGRFEYETVDAPCENVAFVATGNIGANFKVPSGGIDEAVYKRFAHLRVNWNPTVAERIFDAELSASGIGSKHAKTLLAFVEETRKMANDRHLAYGACIRTVVRAIRNAGNVAQLRGELDALCVETLCGWEREGTNTPSNMDAIKTMIAPILSKLA